MTGNDERRQMALGLAARHGFAVFTLAARAKEPHKGSHGFKDATRDAATIEAMFAAYPDSNIAVACGAVSGNIGVIDLDVAEDGSFDGCEELAEWQAEHGKFPDTASAVTGRGGTHLYYRFPDGAPDSYKNENTHVDFRGEKGYAMLPGSIHPNGREVYWDMSPDECAIAEVDENVLAFVMHHCPGSDGTVLNASGEAGRKDPFELPETLCEGARDETLYRFACSMRSKCVPKDVALAATRTYNEGHCAPPLSDSIVIQKVESAYRHPPGTSRKSSVTGEGVETISGASIWTNPHLEAKLNKDGDCIGFYAPTVPALTWWMREDPGLAGVRLERMSQQVVIEHGLPWGADVKMWRPVDDDYLFARMQERYKFDGRSLVRSDKNVFAAFSIFSDGRSFDALVDMLDALPEWDGTPRKDLLLIECLGAEDSPYVRAVTALLLRAAVACAYQPGCKYDYMVVLQGPQGIGKSTLLRRLAMRDELFVDDVKNIGTKEAQELIQGRWFVELAELAAFKGRQVETLKSFITSQTDSYRVPYAKRPVQLPRRCVLVGTTNLGEYLEDPTGNRRFMPVRCGGGAARNIFAPDFAEYVQQVWAEVLADYRANPNCGLVLPRSVENEANAIRERATTEDPWIGLIGRYLLRKKQGEPVCTMQILVEAIQIPREGVKKGDNMRVSSIISRHFPEWRRCPSNRVIDGYGSQRAFVRKTSEELEAERNGVQGRLPGV